jgi:di/tricarboxylate transporter
MNAWDFLSLFLKYLGYGAILAVYAAFAWFGKPMPEGLTIILTGMLGVLGAANIASAATKAATPPKIDVKDNTV